MVIRLDMLKMYVTIHNKFDLSIGIMTPFLDPNIKLFPQRERSAPLYIRVLSKNAKEFGHRYGDNYITANVLNHVSLPMCRADNISSHGVIQMHP
jgi:hypothetical protein